MIGGELISYDLQSLSLTVPEVLWHKAARCMLTQTLHLYCHDQL